MSWKATIDQQIWSDRGIKSLDAEQFKAFIWLMTNPNRNIIGATLTDPETFQFHTQTQFSVLVRVANLLPESVRYWQSKDNYIFLLTNFVRHQVKKKQLTGANPVARSVCAAIRELPEELLAAMIPKYPELHSAITQPLTDVDQPLKIPASASGWTTTRERAEQSKSKSTPSEGGSKGDGFSEAPSDDEIFEFVESFKGDMRTGAPPMNREWAMNWVGRMASRTNPWVGNWRQAMKFGWLADFRAFMPKDGTSAGAKFGAKTNRDAAEPATIWRLQQKLEQLQARAIKHEGNPESASFFPGLGSDPDFEALAVEILRVRKEMSELQTVAQETA